MTYHVASKCWPALFFNRIPEEKHSCLFSIGLGLLYQYSRLLFTKITSCNQNITGKKSICRHSAFIHGGIFFYNLLHFLFCLGPLGHVKLTRFFLLLSHLVYKKYWVTLLFPIPRQNDEKASILNRCSTTNSMHLSYSGILFFNLRHFCLWPWVTFKNLLIIHKEKNKRN